MRASNAAGTLCNLSILQVGGRCQSVQRGRYRFDTGPSLMLFINTYRKVRVRLRMRLRAQRGVLRARGKHAVSAWGSWHGACVVPGKHAGHALLKGLPRHVCNGGARTAQ